MSRRRKQRDNFVQSLFPFLAVLLSTMGALVLLLMLIVNQAQASAKQMAVEKKVQIEDAESNLQLIRNTFEERLDDRRLELERKRLLLQHLEKHIQELIEELKGIERTAVLLDQKQTQDKTAEGETERKISQLEKQLTDAKLDLKKKLDKPEGEKPIFAIIPYQGTNGTHRRPIYLECTNQGVTIQPEGVLIGLADLRPPYGPGNPLDAAIRTVRSRFAPANGALTSTAYPLLIVRPSGVRTYAMARQAMAGWDDQFGYELIDESLELTFPESEPGIVAEIDQALALARERQAALVMAMPAKYRQYINQGGSANESLDFSDDASDMGDEWAGGGTGSGTGNRTGPGGGSNSSSGYRGGFAASQSGTTGQRAVGGSGNAAGGGTGFSQRNGAAGPGSQQLGVGGGSSDAQPGGASYFADGGGVASAGSTGSYFGSSTGGSASTDSSSTSGDFAAGKASGNDGGSGGNGDFADTSSRSIGGDTGFGAGDRSSGSTGPSNGRPGNNGPGNSSVANGGPTSGAMGPARDSGSASGGAGGGGGAASMGNAMNSPSGNAMHDPTAKPGDPVQSGPPSLNMDMSRKSGQGTGDSQTQPVARQRGRNWAWNEGPPSKTPVVRSIRVVCYNDRWVLMQDNSTTSNQVTVPIGQSPQASAERLAKVITDRVGGWGIALGGGYWKPELLVDVAPGAEGRYSQLERLLEGSGLNVKRRAAVK